MTALPTLHRRHFVQGALAASAVGCARRDNERLTFWSIGREADRIGALFEEFERRHPGIRIKLEKLPWTAAHQKLLTAFAGNSLPDVFQIGNTWIPEFVTLDALAPLNAFVIESGVVKKDDYFSGVWDTNVIDGNLYGLPWYVDTRLLFYRKDLLAQAGFDAPPTDWTQWSAMLRAIKRMVGADRYSILLPLNEFEPLLNLGIQHPEPLLRDGDRYGNFRSESFRKTLTFYGEAFVNRWAPLMTNTQISNVWDEFGHGLFSFYISGPWNIVEFQKRLPAALKDAWSTAPMPGPEGPGASIAGGSSLVIAKRAQKSAAAWKLIEFFSAPDVQIRYHELTGNMPPRRASWSPSLSEDRYAQAFRTQLERVKSTPKVPEWERIATEVRLVGEVIAQRGDASPAVIDAACIELDRRVDAILAKRRSVLAARSNRKDA
jgi:multiple sugar transport system substrate-binding protein